MRGIATTPPYGYFGDQDMEVGIHRVFDDRTKNVDIYLYNMPKIGSTLGLGHESHW